ncbi:MAG: hypothetical protein Kow0069_22900 [Promethearchaeota archaeon]
MRRRAGSSRFVGTYLLSTTGDFCASLTLVASVFLATDLGATPLEVGLVGGAYGVVYSVAPVALGRIGDRFPRKLWLVLAFSGVVVVSAANAVAVRFPVHLIATNGALGFCFGFFWPTVEAFLSENVESSYPARHQRVLGNFCVAWSVGYMLGPWVAGQLYGFSPRAGFFLVTSLALAGLIASAMVLPAGTAGGSGAGGAVGHFASGRVAGQTNEVRARGEPRAGFVVLFAGVGALGYAFGKQVLVALFPNYAVLPGGLGWSESLAGDVLFFLGLGRTGAFVYSRSRPPRDVPPTIAGATACFGVATCLVAALRHPAALALDLLGVGAFTGLLYAGSLHLTLTATRENKGRNAGLFEGLIGAGSVVAPVAGGAVAALFLPGPYLVVGATFAAVGAWLVVRLRRSPPVV